MPSLDDTEALPDREAMQKAAPLTRVKSIKTHKHFDAECQATERDQMVILAGGF